MKDKNQMRHIGIMFKCVDKKIVRELNKKFEQYGLTLMQHEVMSYLFQMQDDHDVYQKEIEEHLESTNPTVTGLVKRLELKELIERTSCSHDARCKKLRLTEKGMAVHESIRKVGPEMIEKKLTKHLDKQEVELLMDLLDKVGRGLDEE